jgi:hypothetical protein
MPTSRFTLPLGGHLVYFWVATIRTESLHLAVEGSSLGALQEEESDFRVPTNLSMRERGDAEV